MSCGVARTWDVIKGAVALINNDGTVVMPAGFNGVRLEKVRITGFMLPLIPISNDSVELAVAADRKLPGRATTVEV